MSSTTKYGLQNADINQIIEVLSRNGRIDQIILFGSRAKGTFTEGSDVDIALKGSELNLSDILEAAVNLDELLLPYKFDLVIYDRIKEPSLREHIDRVGMVLFER